MAKASLTPAQSSRGSTTGRPATRSTSAAKKASSAPQKKAARATQSEANAGVLERVLQPTTRNDGRERRAASNIIVKKGAGGVPAVVRNVMVGSSAEQLQPTLKTTSQKRPKPKKAAKAAPEPAREEIVPDSDPGPEPIIIPGMSSEIDAETAEAEAGTRSNEEGEGDQEEEEEEEEEEEFDEEAVGVKGEPDDEYKLDGEDPEDEDEDEDGGDGGEGRGDRTSEEPFFENQLGYEQYLKEKARKRGSKGGRKRAADFFSEDDEQAADEGSGQQHSGRKKTKATLEDAELPPDTASQQKKKSNAHRRLRDDERLAWECGTTSRIHPPPAKKSSSRHRGRQAHTRRPNNSDEETETESEGSESGYNASAEQDPAQIAEARARRWRKKWHFGDRGRLLTAHASLGREHGHFERTRDAFAEYLGTQNPFPSSDTAKKEVEKAWRTTFNAEDDLLPACPSLPHQLLSNLVEFQSQFRNKLYSLAKIKVEDLYELPKLAKDRSERAAFLVTDFTFLWKRTEPVREHNWGHKAITSILHTGFFSDSNSYGSRWASCTEAVPVALLALVCTAIFAALTKEAQNKAKMDFDGAIFSGPFLKLKQQYNDDVRNRRILFGGERYLVKLRDEMGVRRRVIDEVQLGTAKDQEGDDATGGADATFD